MIPLPKHTCSHVAYLKGFQLNAAAWHMTLRPLLLEGSTLYTTELAARHVTPSLLQLL